MKKLLFLLFLLYGMNCYGQFTIEFDDLLATHKNYVYGYDTTVVQMVELQKTGENNKWDFSLLAFQNPDTVTIMPTTLSKETLNEQLYAVHSTVNKNTSYLKKNKSGLYTQAYDLTLNNQNSVRLNYTIPEKVLDFPLVIRKSFVDSSVGEMKIKAPFANYDSLRIITYTLRNCKIDASGKLLLPSGANESVLKIKVEEKQTQFSFLKKGDQWINSDTLYDERLNYCWIGKNSGHFIMRNEVALTTGKINTSYLNSTFVSSASKNSNATATIFPNPAKDFISVTLKGYEKGTILLECLDENSNAFLRKSHAATSEQSTVELELPNVKPGTYTLRITTKNSVELVKFVVIK